MPLFSFNLELRELSMNKIFRVVWSHAAQSWVAVSELTKAHKKASTSNAIKVMLGSTALLFSLNSAEAAVSISSTNGTQINSTDAKATHNEAVAIGGGAEAYGEGTIAIGKKFWCIRFYKRACQYYHR